MIYNGQEIGATRHPYTPFPIFKADSSIQSMDSLQLHRYYADLARIRREYPVLQSPYMREVSTGEGLVSFLRWEEGQPSCLVVVNPGAVRMAAEIPSSIPGISGHVEDLLSDQVFGRKTGSIRIDMPEYSVRCLLMTE